MKAAEFEEKEYEAALYSQLESGNSLLWSPGQVLESYLGFDRALRLNDPLLWSLRGFRRPLQGFSPWHSLWPILRNKSWQRSRLPRFRFNCFIQAKRPYVGSKLPKKLAALGSARPYFRFSIESDQQQMLEAAARKLDGRALFTYASPVFCKSRELFRHMRLGSIVTNSTFPDVQALAGQHAWYYNQPGAEGVVNSSFEPLRMLPLEMRIAELVGEHQNETEATQSPSVALAELVRDLQALVVETSGTTEDVRAAYLVEEWRQISALAEEIDAPPALFYFFSIEAFAIYFNLLWLTIA